MLAKFKLQFITFNVFIFSALGISVEIFADHWMRSTGNMESHRFAKDNQINSSNIKNLSKEFTLHFGKSYEDLNVQSSPIFCNEKLFINHRHGKKTYEHSDRTFTTDVRIETF